MIVERRCAIRMVMRCFCEEISLTVAVICSSVNESSAEVASSKINNRGWRSNALAMDNRCFSPPEIFLPPSPNKLSNPFPELFTMLVAEAFSSADQISSSLAPWFYKLHVFTDGTRIQLRILCYKSQLTASSGCIGSLWKKCRRSGSLPERAYTIQPITLPA